MTSVSLSDKRGKKAHFDSVFVGILTFRLIHGFCGHHPEKEGEILKKNKVGNNNGNDKLCRWINFFSLETDRNKFSVLYFWLMNFVVEKSF
jgi:hypothetical protein